jgi:hypothetical protein
MAKKREKLVTNYRVKLVIGKELSRATVADGKGWARTLREAEEMFASLVKKTSNILQAELYFNNQLIKKR